MSNCKVCAEELHDLNWHTSRQKRKHYICNVCQKDYMGRYYAGNYTDIRKRTKDSYKKENFNYGTEKWAIQYLASKRHRDKKRQLTVCDFTVNELLSLINEACTYCDSNSEKIGMDRIDNTKGHTKDNVVACCPTCNSARMDNLTFEEMKILGKTIKLIKENRHASRVV